MGWFVLGKQGQVENRPCRETVHSQLAAVEMGIEQDCAGLAGIIALQALRRSATRER